MRYASIIICIIGIATTTYSADRKSQAAEERLRDNQDRPGRTATTKIRSSSGSQSLPTEIAQDMGDEKVSRVLTEALSLLIVNLPKPICDLIIAYLTTIQLYESQHACQAAQFSSAAVFSRDSRFLAAVTDWGKISIFDLISNKKVCDINVEFGTRVLSLLFCPSGRKLFIGTSQGIMVRDVLTGSYLADCTLGAWEKRWAEYLACNPDGSILASGLGFPRRIILWNITEKNCKELQTISNMVGAIAFSHNGKLIASCADAERRIRIWTVKDPEDFIELSGHAPETHCCITSFDFSSDDKLLLSTAHDHTARLWNIASKTCIATLMHGVGSQVSVALFHPTQNLYITASRNPALHSYTVTLWRPQLNNELVPEQNTMTYDQYFSESYSLDHMAFASVSSHGKYLVFGSPEVPGIKFWCLNDPIVDEIVRARTVYDAQRGSEERWKRLGKKIKRCSIM